MKILAKLPIQFNKPDEDGDIFVNGSFDNQIDVPLIRDHDPSKLIGIARPIIINNELFAQVEIKTGIGYQILERDAENRITKIKLVEVSLIS